MIAPHPGHFPLVPASPSLTFNVLPHPLHFTLMGIC